MEEENMARKQTQVLTLEEKLEDARTKNKALEKKISRKDVDIFKLESEIQSLMDRLRNKEGQINMYGWTDERQLTRLAY